ncbi:hypothetical protein MAR_032084 [Mya arenaria]|uniref:MULE transposase domain-containing protein n=1 Tax=Mya arenaria TaxID=6604 RepID=A0ABY7F5R2_MYAAR|nr:hypothetical protein MAR_032084 [Mya arenaria]
MPHSNSIKNAIVGQCAVEGMVLDYERGLWKAAKDVFPAIELRGCSFHWGQAFWRTVQINERVASSTEHEDGSGATLLRPPPNPTSRGQGCGKQIHLVSELSLRRIQQKSTRSMQSGLFSAWDAYTAGDISTSGLLKKVSVIYGHRVLRTEEVEDEY